MRRALRLLGWGIVTAAAVAALLGLDWSRAWKVLLSASPAWMAAAVAANLAILVLWAWQWRGLLPRDASVPFPTMFSVASVMSTVANGGPTLAGQATGVQLLATWGGVGYAGALSVAALDQLAEGIAKLALLGLVAAVTPLPPGLRSGVFALTAGVGLLGAVLLVAAHRHDDMDLPLPLSAREGPLGRSWDLLLRAARRLEALRSPRLFATALVLALAMKGAELAGIAATQAALGVDVGFGGSLLVLASVSLATMLTVAPGNLGVYEVAAFAAYRVAGLEPAAAVGVALLQHLLFLVPAAGTGWVVLTLRGGATRWARWTRGTADEDAGK